MHHFFVYEHPLLSQRILKRGFSWPAFLIGPAWLLFKKLWAQAAIVLVVAALLYFLGRSSDSSDDPLLASIFCSSKDYIHWNNFTFYRYSDLCLDLLSWYDFVVLLVVNLFIAGDVNSWWASDLIKRGYVLSRTIEARSLDDARGKLVRDAAQSS